MASSKLFLIIAWWDHVTLTPEDNKIIVFNKGTPKALNTLIPKGGQIEPSSILGDSLLLKKAQKKEKKNITSDKINNTIPHRIPVSTINVWSPWKVLSRVTSRHHCAITKSINKNLKNNK